MSSDLIAIAVDCRDAEALAAFWCAALGYRVTGRWADERGTGYVEVGIEERDPILLFQPVPESKGGKNRLHLDVRPSSGSQADEVARLCTLGAAVLDEAPGLPWIVLVDPEGNEFCVLPRRDP